MPPDDLPKLVRDRIPEIIRDDGDEPVVETAPPDAVEGLLADKLVEEAEEFAASRDPEELADVLEVLDRLREEVDADVERLREEKRAERGGFDAGTVLRDIDG